MNKKLLLKCEKKDKILNLKKVVITVSNVKSKASL